MSDGRGRGGERAAAPAADARAIAVPVALALAAAVAGCATVFGGGTHPSGLADWDHRLRSLLRQGRHEQALELVAPERAEAGDELLRLQQEGAVAHYAGDWRRSSDALERAFRMTEDRYTKSVSKAVLSMLVSDRVLDYYPPPPERLFMHYYGALNYLRRGDPEEAAVEARRLGRLLERGLEADDFTTPPALGRALSRFAGAVFEAAGQWNDAAVAYRRARAFRTPGEERPARAADIEADPGVSPAGSGSAGADSAAASGVAAGRDSAASPGAPWARRDASADSTGDVLVVVERGFVAHKVERGATVFLLPDEVRRLREYRRDARDGDDDAGTGEILALARRVADRGLRGLPDPASRSGQRGTGGWWGTPPRPGAMPRPGRPGGLPDGRSGPDGRDGQGDDEGDDEEDDGASDSDSDPVIFRIAWPVYRETTPVRGVSSLVVDGDTAAVGPDARTDVSDAVRAAYAERKALDIAKTLLRAVTKTAVAEGIEEAVSEEDETLGEIAGLTARIAGAVLERADTRCWHLLPARLELYRLRLPAGTHRLEAVVPGRGAREPKRLSLGPVEVEPGSLRVVSARTWE